MGQKRKKIVSLQVIMNSKERKNCVMILKTIKILTLLMLLSPLAVTAQTENDEYLEYEDSLTENPLMADTMQAVLVPWPQNVQIQIDMLLEDPLFKKSQVAVEVYDLTADSVIYKHNERQLMRPASTQKIITAITAIDRLGGAYQFRTRLFYTGSISDGVLNGNVICQGGFDPKFNTDDMKAFVESLQKMGVDTIRGNLIADVSMKDKDEYGEGWCWDDDNHVLTPLLISRKDKFMDKFLEFLQKEGVVVTGEIKTGVVPQSARAICARFHTIDQILKPMMKESDNLYAESMFYQTAASGGAHPASARHARAFTRQLIKKMGLNPDDYKVADGSGLSLYNYVTAEEEVAFLRYAYNNINIYEHFLPSLPIAGVDGTLKNRMKGTHAADNVRAKTGTVTAIVSLAGYCTAANGHNLCFSIINQGLIREKAGRAFQDKVCLVLCNP